MAGKSKVKKIKKKKQGRRLKRAVKKKTAKKKTAPRLKKALLVVDLQRDFCPGGTLAIPKGDKVVRPLNRAIRYFLKKKLPVFLSRDWHPPVTRHFKAYGGPWPKHCIQHTEGARFHPDLRIPKEAVILSKGMDPDKGSYSAFRAEDARGLTLEKILPLMKVGVLYVGGLATDYCVKQSVLDALRAGFKVEVLTDAVRGVDVRRKDSEEAIKAMVARGARRTSLKKLIR